MTSSNCSGTCSAGYYCPQGSLSAFQQECGSPNYYCPEGTHERLAVTPGYYTIFTTTEVGQGLDRIAHTLAKTTSSQILCEEGYFCIRGIRYLCPPGTYGNQTGLTSNQCTNICPKGTFTANTSSITLIFRILGYHCPLGTNQPIACPAGVYGNAAGLSTNLCTGECPVAHFWY